MATAKRSKSGLPTLTENGGGSTNTGMAMIICGSEGQPLAPLFVPRGYSNGDHAIFAVHIGNVIVRAEHSKAGESVTLNRITAIHPDDGSDKANAVIEEPIGSYENGDSDTDNFTMAMSAALEKSKCYHCREPHFIA